MISLPSWTAWLIGIVIIVLVLRLGHLSRKARIFKSIIRNLEGEHEEVVESESRHGDSEGRS
ncbi:MAG: hypothetical protein AAB432_02980 [Patescibacteria group bacterium]